MGRLTNSIDYCTKHCDFGKRGECFFKDKSKCYEKSMHDKLKAYEDIIDDPGKLKLIDELYLERCEEINRLNAKLAEYKKLEEEGVLLRLPCKVGDKVYNLIPRLKKANNFQENEVTTIKVYSDSVYIFLKNGLAKDTKQIGKTVFLTKEEAEQALGGAGC